MITNKDLQEAIAECQGVRNPDANTCIKLASYYTIMEHMNGENYPLANARYSYEAEPASRFGYMGDSTFLQSIEGGDIKNVMALVDELIGTLQVINPRLHDGFMRKLKEVV